MADEMLTEDEVVAVSQALNSRRVDDLVAGVMSIEKVLFAIKGIIAKVGSNESAQRYY